MKIINTGRKYIVRDYTNREAMDLKRRGVNVEYNRKNNCIEAEDNVYNRIILGISNDNLLSDVNVEEIVLDEFLREYQVNDVRKMLKFKNILNRNRMGYGKTLETIEYCKVLNLQNILVLCPKSVIGQWKKEFAKWWPESASRIVDKPDKGIYVTNYESLDNAQRLMSLKRFTWDVMICDESHRIKNQRAKRTINVKSIPTARKVALTGTPILTKPDDLWSQLHWFGDRYSSRSYWKFCERFCEIEEDNWGKKLNGLTPSDKAKSLLSQALNLMTVGGDNQNVTQGKNYIETKLPMSKEQKRLYQDIKRLALDSLNAQGITVKNAMDQFIKMQQVTSNTSLFGDIENPKFVWLKEWLQDSGDAKIVVFTKFSETLKALQKYLGNDVVSIFHGKLNSNDREKAKDAFINGKCRVLAGTIGAMGVGVDGLQHVCSNVVFLDRDWSPAINEQAEDRVNRSGQKGLTNIYILKMEHSIDEHVEEVINHKGEDIEELNKWILSWC